MRITIDVQQAPGFSFIHLSPEVIEDAIFGMCTDPDAKIFVEVQAALDEDTQTVQFR